MKTPFFNIIILRILQCCVLAIQRQRLTGLGTPLVVPPSGGSPLLVSETISTDLRGNQTIQQTAIDRDNKTVIQTVDYPDSITDALSVTINGLLISSTTKTGLDMAHAYDALGRRIATTDERTGTSTTHFNTKGQVDWVEDAATNRTTFAYDPATGRRISTTDALTNSTYQAYSVEGQLIATWGATYPVYYEYDAFDRMSAMYTYRGTNEINSLSAFESELSAFDKTTWLYDDATGLLTNKLYSDQNGTAYTYTPDGKLATRTWARGITTTYSYNIAGQLATVDYSDDTPDVAYAYNRAGQQITASNSVAAYEYQYDPATLALTNEIQVITGGITNVLTRSYDTLGRFTGLGLRHADSIQDDYAVSYAYDNFGQFHKVIWGGTTATYSRVDNASLIEGYTIVGQAPSPVLSVAKSYEPTRNLITDIDNISGTNLVSSFAYQNDAIGRRTKRVDNASATNVFGYNIRSEVIEAVMGTNAYGYGYDPIGNRQWTSVAGVVDPGSAVTNEYASNPLNQYTNITREGEAPDEPQYDADGNLTSYNGWTFTWNGENRMIAASNSEHQVTYAYDHQGRMIAKSTDGVPLTFAWDEFNIIAELSSSHTNYNAWGLDLSGSMQGAGGVGGLLATIQDGAVYFAAYDANGNVTEYVDVNGTVVAHREYSPFGQTTALAGTKKDDFTHWWSTKPWDPVTGLSEYEYRKYHPELGRWMNRDPIEELAFCYLLLTGESPNYASLLMQHSMTAQVLVLSSQRYREKYLDLPRLVSTLQGNAPFYSLESPYILENIYSFLTNPINHIDAIGLTIYVCSSDGFGIPGVHHAYVWDSESGLCCGTSGSSGSETGRGCGDPVSDACVPVDIPAWRHPQHVIVDLCDCVEDLDNKAWIPIIRDCHNQLEECFNRQRIVYPGAPGGRFGPKPGNPFFPEPRPPRRRRPPF